MNHTAIERIVGTMTTQARKIIVGSFLVRSVIAISIFAYAPPIVAQAGQGYRWDHDVSPVSNEPVSVANVKVSIDASKMRNIIAYRGFAINISVSDGKLVDPQVVSLLNAAAVNTLRYPGGSYADSNHWSTYKATNWQGEQNPRGVYQPNNDFGFFARLLDYVQNGTAIITANYGSNLAGTGGGEPPEAAVWVAYCNGDPSEDKVIGKDSTGYDWKTVGYWASMRGNLPLDDDDGFNFLRINHPRPLNFKYWEIGNETYNNGYFVDQINGGSEEDLHAPYAENAKDSNKMRHGNAALSPASYGKGAAEFAKAMKAVDPTIRVGAILFNPADEKKAAEWNPAVMAECVSIAE